MSRSLRRRWDGGARLWYRLWTKATCHWFVIALHCARKGHDWQEEHACIAMGFTACAYCGQLRGHYRKDNGREKCSRIVIDSPGHGHVQFAKYPPTEGRVL